MSTEMTPMKRYSTGLQNLKMHLNSISRKTELNKSASKRDYDGDYSKGVKSDYILIFKDIHSETSFALVFEYMDLPTDKQRVVGNIKTDDNSIKSSYTMTLEDFKSNLNALNKDLNISITKGKFDFPEAVSLISKHMLKEVIDFKNDLKKANSTVSRFLTSKLKELDRDGYEEVISNAEKTLDKAQRAVAKKIADSPLTIEKKALVERLLELDRLMDQESKKFTAIADIKGKQQAVIDSKKALNDRRDEINKEVDVKLESFPATIRNRVKKSI